MGKGDGRVRSRILNKKGYFASYNIALDPFIYELSGAEKLYEQYISNRKEIENGIID